MPVNPGDMPPPPGAMPPRNPQGQPSDMGGDSGDDDDDDYDDYTGDDQGDDQGDDGQGDDDQGDGGDDSSGDMPGRKPMPRGAAMPKGGGDMEGQETPVAGDDVLKALRLGVADIVRGELSHRIEHIEKALVDLHGYVGQQTTAINQVTEAQRETIASYGELEKSLSAISEEITLVKGFGETMEKALGSVAGGGTTTPGGEIKPSDVLKKAGVGVPADGEEKAPVVDGEDAKLIQKALLATQMRRATPEVAEIANKAFNKQALSEAEMGTLRKSFGGQVA